MRILGEIKLLKSKADSASFHRQLGRPGEIPADGPQEGARDVH